MGEKTDSQTRANFYSAGMDSLIGNQPDLNWRARDEAARKNKATRI
jgi:hypothetical protein